MGSHQRTSFSSSHQSIAWRGACGARCGLRCATTQNEIFAFCEQPEDACASNTWEMFFASTLIRTKYNQAKTNQYLQKMNV